MKFYYQVLDGNKTRLRQIDADIGKYPCANDVEMTRQDVIKQVDIDGDKASGPVLGLIRGDKV